ncbi:MAG: helix-turn-helix transcriptional regulator [Zoogloeaceae bacterium]|nr:helix-turn-helix transcriptional regulator [Rhodocyclaceae bacterium]MCP5235514.1 helix-turn-helix transcriptional regulator [Zoogloeaceae bacterium]
MTEKHGGDRESGESSDGMFLSALGERVRELRLRRGMARATLARDSGVSLRYLAQLEAGDGNISVVRLRRVAHALALPLDEVLRVGPGPSPELARLTQFLSRLSSADLGLAASQVYGAFEKQGRRDRIALIGLRGAGKSAVGRLLAQHLGVPFFEMGEIIEHSAGMTLPEIFSLYGQGAYRRYERRTLDWIVENNERFVLATGGSIVTEAATFDELLGACFAVWLKASPGEHMKRVIAQGDRRPMMGDDQEALKDLERILVSREPMHSRADLTVDTTGLSVPETFAELRRRLEA